MSDLRETLRLFSEDDAPLEDVARVVAQADPDEAVAEVRRAHGLGWVHTDEMADLLRNARRRS